MANINFQGNPQHVAAAAGGVIAAIATAPAWLLGLGAAAAVGIGAYAISEANKKNDENNK